MNHLRVIQRGIRYIIVFSLTLVLTAVFTLYSPTVVFATELSLEHSAFFDPHTQKLVGEKTAKGVAKFFHDAEMAIETENIDALMSLYSHSYVNGPHTKQSMRLLWLQLFKKYRELVTVHNMRFITIHPNSTVMIIKMQRPLDGHSRERGWCTAS